MKYVAGIDIGTTSLCTIIADAETGTAVEVKVRANDAGLTDGHSWERTQDPQRIMAIIEEMISEQFVHWKQVSSIGISCQMHGILYVDGQGNAASPLYTWQDGRGALPMEGSVSGTTACAAYMEEASGYKLAAGYGMVTHFYNMRNGIVPANAAYLCTIGDYVAMKLSGRRTPLMEASNAASLGLYDSAARSFDLKAMKALGIDERMIPPLSEESEIAGTTPSGQIVACAIGDNQASFLGSVPSLEQSMLVNIGTGAQISIYSRQIEAMSSLETRPFPGGGCLLVGASLGGGKTYALLGALFRDIVDSFADAPLHSSGLYERMTDLAEEALQEPGDPLQVSAQFFGTRHDPEQTGTIAGITNRNWTAGHLTLGFLSGIADELLTFADLFPDSLRSRVSAVAASGNGIRKNRVMRQLLQTKLGHPLYLSPVEEEAALGAAIYAAVQSGMFPDAAAAVACFRKE